MVTQGITATILINKSSVTTVRGGVTFKGIAELLLQIEVTLIALHKEITVEWTRTAKMSSAMSIVEGATMLINVRLDRIGAKFKGNPKVATVPGVLKTGVLYTATRLAAFRSIPAVKSRERETG